MANSTSTEEQSKKKKKFFFSSKKKQSKQEKDGSLKAGNKETRSEASTEMMDRAKVDNQAYEKAKRESNPNLIALAYTKTTTKSFKQRGSFLTEPTEKKAADSDSGKTTSRFSFILTGSSFFRKMCDDVFDSIDVDKSGKINESELYQGLLLIHLKLGLYFGAPACKPISLDRTKFIFNELDTNEDGTLDKCEFRKVLTLLMGNVVSRILFQFMCTLLIVPFLAKVILEKLLDGYGYSYGIVTESWLPVFREEYLPLLEMALGLDLISRYVIDPIQEIGIADLVEVPTKFVAEKFDVLVLQPISEIPQETWDSLPLTVLTSILTMIIVPYSILKADDLFQFLAKKFGK